jgi:6-phosphogluconolactonase
MYPSLRRSLILTHALIASGCDGGGAGNAETASTAAGSSAGGSSGAGARANAGGAAAAGRPGQGGASGAGQASSAGAAGADGSVLPTRAAFAYVGTYDNQIHVYSFDPRTGSLTQGRPAATLPNPSFLAFAPDGQYLYAVNEANDLAGGAGAVSSFRIDPTTGGLVSINRVSSQGAGPAHVATDHTGKLVFVANYSGGNIAVLPVGSDGTLGAAVDSREHGAGAQAHATVIDPSNRFLFVPNKGRSDVSQYRFDAQSGAITPNTPAALALPAGAGSRHLAFHPSLPYAYLINELDDSIAALAFDTAQGTLSAIQTVPTLPPGVDGSANSTAEIQVAPSGKFVYGSNRGHDSLVIHAVDAATGRLSLVGHRATGGATPRSFQLEQTGKFLLVANQGSDEVVTFQVDPDTGLLSELGSVSVRAPAFVGVLYLP